MLSVGALIWVSLRPLIRLVLVAAFGFAITKADIFPQVAARGAGQIMLNITLPCLMFSKIVPAFTSDNIGALGPLVLVGVTYQAMGAVIAWITKQFFWVPHRFRYGILIAGGFPNIGDIPNAVVMSIAGNAPFNGTGDQDRAVAYIAAVILVFFILLFPAGSHRLIAWDYEGPGVEDEEVKEAIRVKRKTLFTRPLSLLPLRRRSARLSDDSDPEKASETPRDAIAEKVSDVESKRIPLPRTSSAGKHVTFGAFNDDGDHDDHDVTIAARSPPPTTAGPFSPAPTVTHVDEAPAKAPIAPAPAPPKPFAARLLTHALAFMHSLLTPASLAILTAFPIALITPLKALFLPVDGWTGARIPNAPDGQPPLAFVMDTATFVGAASVPLGLTCLGSALARLKVPRGEGWGSLPLGAIGSLAVGKMLVMPVIGVLMCQGLTRAGIIDPDDKVLRFVCIFLSCVPTATTQVFLTQVYSGTGDASALSAFLIPQYAMMVVSMTVLTAFTINLLF